jgi:alpha-1,3-rhamnosyl/mannosyltransferase
VSLTIGLSANVVAPELTAGRLDGIGTYTLALERELAALGIGVTRIRSPRLLRSLATGGASAPGRTAEVEFGVRLPAAIAMSALTGRAAIGASRVERAIDLYHATDYQVPRLRRVPVVATLYDAIPLRHPEWANARWRRAKNWLLRRSAGNADRIIAISQAGAQEVIEHYGVARDRVRVVPLGVDARWFQAPAREAAHATLARRGLRPGFFLFVGTLQPRKNVGALLSAHDRLPRDIRDEHQLVIAGKLGWRADALHADLLRRRESGRVRWLDYVPTEELAHLYAAACALVFPSLAEGFGLPVLEGLAAGTPVITSDLPALREAGGEVVTYVPPGDEDALAGAMIAAARHTESPGAQRVHARAPSAGAEGESSAASVVQARQRHAERFTWRACAERTLAVYREVL